MPTVTLNPTALNNGTVGFESDSDLGSGIGWYNADPGAAGYGFLAGDVGADCEGALLFIDAGIPKNATINSANLQISGLTLATTGNCGAIVGVRGTDPGVFSNGNLPSTDSLTTAAIVVTTSNYTNIDVTSVVQELVNQTDWTTASNLGIIWASAGEPNGVLKSTTGQAVGDYDLVVDYTAAATIERGVAINALSGVNVTRRITHRRSAAMTAASTLTASAAGSTTLNPTLYTNTQIFYSAFTTKNEVDVYHDLDFRQMTPGSSTDTSELAPADGSGITNIVLANNNDGGVATWGHVTDPIQGNVIEFYAPGRSNSGGNPTVPKASFRDLVLSGTYGSGLAAVGEGDVIECSMLAYIEGSANGLLIIDNEDEGITYDGGTVAGFLGLRTRGSSSNGYLEEDTSEIYSNAANLTSSTPIPVDRWFVLRKRVTLSANPSIGKIEFWIDGVPVTMTNVDTSATDGHTRTLLDPTEFFNETGFTIDSGQEPAYDSLEYGVTALPNLGGTERTMYVAAFRSYGLFAPEALSASVSITSATSLTAVATATRPRAAAISSQSILTVARSISRSRAVAVTSTTSLSATATVTRGRAAAITAATELAVTDPLRTVTRATAISAATELTTVAGLIKNRAAAITAESTVEVGTPTKTLSRAVSVLSETSLTVDYAGETRRTAYIASTTAMSATATVTRIAEPVSITAESTLTATATREIFRAASVEASSDLSAQGSTSGNLSRAVEIEATTTLAATAAKTIRRAVSIAANSSTAAEANVSYIYLRAVEITSESTFSAQGNVTRVRSVSITSTTSLEVTVFARDPRTEPPGRRTNTLTTNGRNIAAVASRNKNRYI